jgi:hypothetical protein
MPMVQIRRLEGGFPERSEEMTVAVSEPASFQTPTSGTAVIAEPTGRHRYGSGWQPPSVGPADREAVAATSTFCHSAGPDQCHAVPHGATPPPGGSC